MSSTATSRPSSSPATRRARVAGIVLAATMILTMAGSAVLGVSGSGGSTSPAPSPGAAPTTQVVDLDSMTQAELEALSAQYTPTDSAPTTP